MAAASGANIMPASIEAAKAGVTTGEWGDALRAEFGEFRAPTGVSPQARQEAADLDALRGEVERVSLKLGRRIKFLVGKPGLDGHSNGAEQIAVRALDAGHGRRLRRHPLHARPRSSSAPRRASIASACRSSRARMSR